MKNNKGRLKYFIKSIINSKNITENMYKKCEKYLDDYFKEVGKKDYFYFLYYSKLCLIKNDLENSQRYLDKAKEINSSKPSLYFLQFKINVKNNDYDKASINLKKYEELLEKENNKVNLSVYFNILNKLNKKDEYKIFFDNFVNCVNIEDEYFLKLWREFITYLIVEDYTKAKLLLNSIENYIKDNDVKIKLDFNELTCLLESLKTNKPINVKNKLKTKINDLINDNNLEYADNYCYLLSNLLDNESDISVELLKRKINEKKLENRISTNSYLKNYHRQCFEYGKLCQYYHDYDNAINYFSAGFYITKDPIFIYRIAKIHLFNQDLKKAKEYFSLYIKLGYKKLKKASGILDSLNSEKEYSKIEEKFFLDDYNAQYDLDSSEVGIILNSFDTYNSKRKKEKIRILYQNGYRSIAERLLKKYKNDIENEDKIQLYKNKKLYILQSKNK